MTTPTLAVLIVGLLAVPTLPGVWAWWPSRGDPTCRRDLGVALMTGAVVAGAILLIQIVFDARIASIEHHRQAEQRRRDQIARVADARASLQLTVGLARNLRGMDFRGKDLSGFYLGWKNLRDALFGESRLENAMLPGADLRGASMGGANLRNAHLDRARLENANLGGADLRGAVLSEAHIGGADLTYANLSGANLRTAFGRATFARAYYDSKTQWPRGVGDPKCAPRLRWCQMPGDA